MYVPTLWYAKYRDGERVDDLFVYNTNDYVAIVFANIDDTKDKINNNYRDGPLFYGCAYIYIYYRTLSKFARRPAVMTARRTEEPGLIT